MSFIDMRAVKLTNGIENNVRRTKAMFFHVLRYVYNKGYKNIFSLKSDVNHW